MAGLRDLSYEIYNRIAENLPTAEDIISFAKTCRVTQNAIYDTHASCWRHRFGSLYDLPPTKAVTAIRTKFVERKLLRFRLIFKLGDGRASRGHFTEDEERALELMRDLIVGTYNMLRLDPICRHPETAHMVYRTIRKAVLTFPVLQNPTVHLPHRSRSRTTSRSCATWQSPRTFAA
jgi:hypothetical protein